MPSGELLADPGLLAELLAQVVELGAADVANRGHVDAVDLRGVERKRALHADSERLLAHGEGLVHARALTLDAGALEHLDALARALDHAEVHARRVARLEL